MAGRGAGLEREIESMREGADPFDACTLVELRQRRSEKWATHPPRRPAGLRGRDGRHAGGPHPTDAQRGHRASTLSAAIVRGDTGYAHDGYRAMNDREAIKVLIAF